MPNFSMMSFDVKLSKALGDEYGRTYNLPYITEDLGSCECCKERTGEYVSGGLLLVIPPSELRALGVPPDIMYEHSIRLCDVCGLVFYAEFHGYKNKAQAIRLLQYAQGLRPSHARKEVDEIAEYMEVYRERISRAQEDLDQLVCRVIEVEVSLDKIFPIIPDEMRVSSIKRKSKYEYTIKLMKEKL